MRRKVSEEFGAWVQQVLNAHNTVSMRQADLRTGVNHVTLGRMVLGQVPEMESVVRFAQAYGEDVNRALVLAGYDPISPSGPEVFWQEFGEAHRTLAAEGIYLPAPAHNEESPDYARMTPEQARAEVARLVEAARADAAKL